MLITGTRNQSANLELHSFQFSPSTRAAEDWLEISVNLVNSKESWHVIDPSLTTGEVWQLVKWLYNLYRYKPTDKDLYFIEPNLSFHLVHARDMVSTFKITFNAELKPPWCDKDKEYSIICQLTNEQIQDLASDLCDQLGSIYAKAGFEDIPWGNK